MVKSLNFKAAVAAYETYLSDFYGLNPLLCDCPDPKKSFTFHGTWCLRGCWGEPIAQVEPKGRVWVGR